MNKYETAPVEGREAGSGLSAAVVRDELDKLLSSDGFSKAPRMISFLRFIVSETLAGRADRLKEYAIAVEVFERGESFDPKTNAVVRVEASRLRHRLREYFLGPGRDDPIRIALPTGSYVPEFSTGAGREDWRADGFPRRMGKPERRSRFPTNPRSPSFRL